MAGAISLKVGWSATISLVIPCMSLASLGIGISGLTRHVWVSLCWLGCSLSTEISTIRSVARLVPVVSRSKKQMGFTNSRFIVQAWVFKGIIYTTATEILL